MQSAPIGLFDSGLGGLLAARRIAWLLPGERLIYVGDTAHLPYGPRPLEQIRQFAHQLADYLVSRGVKLIVIACNSATAAALESIRVSSPVPVIGVIEPGARAAVRETRSSRIGVIGTAATVASGSYERALRLNGPAGLKVFSRACPEFVPLVESGQTRSPAAWDAAARYLAPLRRSGIDTLVLGCTHYPLLGRVIAQTMGPEVRLIDPARETAREVLRLLEERGWLNTSVRKEHEVWTTGDAEAFDRAGHAFWRTGFLRARRLQLAGGEGRPA